MVEATEFLKMRNVIPKDGDDLIIGFDNGSEESLIELLDSYHEFKLKKLQVNKKLTICCICGENYSNPKNDSDTCYDCREPHCK
jgi:hypothetical protein